MGRHKMDLRGKRFGKLSVISFSHTDKRGARTWLCQCDCGKQTFVNTGNLFSYHPVRSCGCLLLCRITHGGTRNGKTPEYIIWGGMIQRCTNKNSASYKWYGARGIGV